MSSPDMNSGSGSRLCIVVAAAAAFMLIGFAAVYVTFRPADNAAPVKAAAPPATTSDKLNRGEMATFVFKKAAEDLPAVTFQDAAGKERTLADWKGKVVLLNLWATWCAPCRKEMPGLDRLQKALGSDKFEVVALAVDRAGPEKAKKFLEDTKVEKLALFIDATARSGAALRAVGMPTTILIDASGREIGRLVGPTEWDSEDALRLIKAQLK
ncbi:MAG TPA: TlpA disulfide reductase family protein [Hyphomicrobiaceae bacterium]|nr:TlpA disulfide reductase family protein [Hyphomicrobiaceae bacterium]